MKKQIMTLVVSVAISATSVMANPAVKVVPAAVKKPIAAVAKTKAKMLLKPKV